MFFEKLLIAPRPNRKWEVLHQSRALTLTGAPLFHVTDKIFTIGSCFAEEIRKALTRRAVTCFPAYGKIAIDPSRMRIDTLPHREHMNYYNTFSIRQELERAAGLWVQDRSDVWTLPNRRIQDGQLVVGEGTVHQDPYRRLVFGATPDDLWDALDQINAVMREGLVEADVVLMTLGMTEVFRKRNNGLVCNQVPVYGGGAGLRETYAHSSTFAENLHNVRRTLQLIRELNPRAKVVVTVSPVPLHRSFADADIFVTNMQSKSTLRAVAGEIVREFDWVTYFPAYEIVNGFGSAAFKPEDLLHVKEEVAHLIVETFMSLHAIAGPPAAPATARG